MQQLTVATEDLKLSVEALQLHLKHVPSTEGIISDFLPRVFKSAASAFTGLLSAKNSTPAISVNLSFDKRRVERAATGDYMIMRERPVVALEGFQGSYLDYSHEAINGLKFYDEILSESLHSFKRLLGELVTNKSAQLELKDITTLYKKAAKVRDSQEASQKHFWRRGSFASNVKVGDVLERMADLSPLAENTTTIHTMMGTQDLSMILSRVQEVNSLVNLLVESIETGELTSLSRQQITNLSEGVISLAHDIEHYALQNYRANIFVVAVDRLFKALQV